jgi:NTP pyrophosphatase (non-canonical NTP hydrolase)
MTTDAHPFSIGSDTLNGLSKVMEECGELVQVIGKIVAYGGLVDHPDGTKLAYRLSDELADVQAALTFFHRHNNPGLNDSRRVSRKIETFERWHDEVIGRG